MVLYHALHTLSHLVYFLLYYFQGYFNALRSEKLGKNIHVTLLCPGPVFTNFLAEAFTDKDGQVCYITVSVVKSENVYYYVFPNFVLNNDRNSTEQYSQLTKE